MDQLIGIALGTAGSGLFAWIGWYALHTGELLAPRVIVHRSKSPTFFWAGTIMVMVLAIAFASVAGAVLVTLLSPQP